MQLNAYVSHLRLRRPHRRDPHLLTLHVAPILIAHRQAHLVLTRRGKSMRRVALRDRRRVVAKIPPPVDRLVPRYRSEVRRQPTHEVVPPARQRVVVEAQCVAGGAVYGAEAKIGEWGMLL